MRIQWPPPSSPARPLATATLLSVRGFTCSGRHTSAESYDTWLCARGHGVPGGTAHNGQNVEPPEYRPADKRVDAVGCSCAPGSLSRERRADAGSTARASLGDIAPGDGPQAGLQPLCKRA